MRITNQQKKELYDIFHKNALNLLDFEISGSYQEFKIKYKYDYFSYFIIKKDHNEFQTTILNVHNTIPGTRITSWNGVLNSFKLWSE